MAKPRCALLLLLCLIGTSLFGTALAASEPEANSPTEICPILIGSPMPPITLEDLDGKAFDLNAAIAAKPTILIYFRGGW
ncbi:MAG: hypothetical protein P8Y96_05500 [Desulfuromonadales bacterium]|jgi:cytochrome oxidase Cu insertion factor (SCO1/SenC/PrrC family)